MLLRTFRVKQVFNKDKMLPKNFWMSSVHGFLPKKDVSPESPYSMNFSRMLSLTSMPFLVRRR